jgi:hypothetical protein
MYGCQKMQRLSETEEQDKVFRRRVDEHRCTPQMQGLCAKALLLLQEGTGKALL